MSPHSPNAPAYVIIPASLVLVAVIGLLDYLTGWEISFSVFYLIPVSVATWYSGREAGIALALISGVAWFTADAWSGRAYSHAFVPYWNALVRMSFFSITVLFVSSRRNALELERQVSRLDHLTGVATSKAFYELAAFELEKARRYPRPLALAFIDLDNFKQVNDTQGHHRGDELLQDAAEVLKLGVRASDVAARLGGDEFAVLLPETGLEEARTMMARVRDELLARMKLRSWPVTFSIGVAVFTEAPADVDAMVHQADRLMYEVKNSGKDGIKVEAAPTKSV